MSMSPRIPVGYRKDGRPIFPIRGGSEPPNQPSPNSPPPGGPPAPAPADPPPANPPRTFTQDEVNAIATREATAAQRTAQQALLQSLGVTDADALKALVDAQRAAEEAGKTQLQRDQEAATAAKTAADAERAEAAKERFEARVERAFAKAGVGVEDEAKLARLRRMVTLDTSADAAAITAEIATLKTDFPALFTTTAEGTPPPAPGSDPGGRPPNTPPGSKTAIERGRERAKARSGGNPAGGGYLKPPGL